MPGLIELAEKGDTFAQCQLGYIYCRGLGVDEDDAESVRWSRKAADQGNAWAMFHLAQHYSLGAGTAKDHSETVRWYRKAAEAGNDEAMRRLGFAYDLGQRVREDDTEAVRWYRKAAEAGNAQARFNLGIKYANGEGVAKDATEAVSWYRKAAEVGHDGAMLNLGVAYANGEGVAKSEAEAVQWYRKAAQAGNTKAMYNLGLKYFNGEGVAKDEKQAASWYRKAAEAGYVDAASALVPMYFDGKGVERDLDQALYWARTAAYKGDKRAIEGLPFVLLASSGIDKTGVPSPEMAAEIYTRLRLSARNGSDDARRLLNGQVLPPIPGDWSLVTDVGDQQQFLERLNRALQKHGYPKPKGQISIRWTELSCYEDARLYEAMHNDGYVYAMLVSSEDWILLNGRSQQLYNFNARHTPRLDRKDRVAEYLCLYNRAIQAKQGTFVVAYSPYVIPWHWKESEATIKQVIGNSQPLRGERHTDGTWRFEGTVCHGNSLFHANYRIHPNGRIEMLEDKTIGGNLQLYVERYENGQRVFVDSIVETLKQNAAQARQKRAEASERAAESLQKVAELMEEQKQLNLKKESIKGQDLNRLRAKAESGDSRAMITLGLMYARGWNVSKNIEASVQWLRRATKAAEAANNESNSTVAAFFLAEQLAHKDNPRKDIAEAVKWYRKAAEGGDREAMMKLAAAYSEGEKNLAPNAEEAWRWLHSAARAGDKVAQWFFAMRNPPVLAARPKKLSPVEKDRLVKLCNSALQEAGYADRRVGGLLTGERFTPLPCYVDGMLCEFPSLGSVDETILVAGNQSVLLTGDAAGIKSFNSRAKLRLDTPEQVAAYLRLYNRGVQGEQGTTVIVEGPADLPWSWLATPETILQASGGHAPFDPQDPMKPLGWTTAPKEIEKIAEHIKPMTVRQTSDRNWKADATAKLGTALYRVTYRIHSDGAVEMINSTAVATHLPLLIEKYEDASRGCVIPKTVAGASTPDVSVASGAGQTKVRATTRSSKETPRAISAAKTTISNERVAPLTEPIRESAKPLVELTTQEKARLRTRSIESLMSYAQRRRGRFENWNVVYYLEACLDRAEPTPAEVYIELALAYLTFGRFDSAIEVLEKAQKEAPRSRLAPFFKQFQTEANKVKTTLTEARDSLRRKGIDVKYPDQRIFVAAFSAVPQNDQFLMLKLTDAYAAAFPESIVALQFVAETNLSFFEYVSAETNVPTGRAKAAIYRGQSALEKMQSLDKENAYPALRLMRHVLLTTFPRGDRGRVRRTQLPMLIINAISDANQNRIYTDAQKAFLLYGKAMYFLYGTSWRSPIADKVISWLEDAAKLDPQSREYSSLLASVRANKDHINRTKLREGEVEAAESEAFARRMLRLPSAKSGRLSRGEEIYFALWNGLWKLAVEDVRSESELLGALLDQISCITCWGSGRDFWDGSVCPGCGGDGTP